MPVVPSSSPVPPAPAATRLLLRDARYGSDDAWRELYARYERMLLVTVECRMPGFLRRRLDAEDVLQDAFARAWKAFDSFEYRGEGSFRRWLRRIVMRELATRLREDAQERRQLPYDDFEGLPDSPSPDERAPSQLLSEIEEQRRLLRGMAALRGTDQELLTLRIFEKKGWKEIAAILGCSRAHASERFARAIARLARSVR